MISEFIVCSAIYFNDGIKHKQQPKNIKEGFVVSGRRHSDCYILLEILKFDFSNFDYSKTEIKQGFITSENRYVSREEAWQIAKKSNQIKFGYNATVDDKDAGLISEHLYYSENEYN